MAPNIYHLPTELWLEIISCLLSSELECLALSTLSQTCQHLHSLCTPVIQKEMVEQFKNTPAELASQENTESIKSLRILLLFHHTLSDLRCVRYAIGHQEIGGFDSIYIETDGRDPDVPVLASLLASCVHNTQSLTVREFTRFGTNRKDTPEDYPFKFFFGVPDAGRRPVSKPPEVTSSSWLVSTFDQLSKWLSNVTGQAQATTSQETRVLLENDGVDAPPVTPTLTWRFQNRLPRHNIPLPIHPLTLTEFYLKSTELFSASMYPWTLHILNHAPIICLLIHVRLSLFHWAQILLSLRMPSLGELQLGDIQLAFPDLKAFLARHPTLKTLDLSLNSPIGAVDFGQDLDPATFLPSLETLIASPEYILPFLKQHQLGYFHKLETLDLRPCLFYGYDAPSNTERCHRERFFGPIFDQLTQRGQVNPKHLHLKLHPMSLLSLIEWVVCAPLAEGQLEADTDVRRLMGVQNITITGGMERVLPGFQILDELVAWSTQYGTLSDVLPGVVLDSPIEREEHKLRVLEKFLLFVCQM